MRLDLAKRNNILVCVTQQKTCEKLIKKGYSLRESNDYGEMFIINVVRENENFLYNQSDSEALEYLFSIARKVEADLTVIRDDDVIKTLADYIFNNDVSCVVMGVSPEGKDETTHPIARGIRKKLKHKIDFVIV